MSAGAFERTLRLIRYSTSAYARGYRAGAGAVLRDDPPPPPPGSGDRGAYRLGFEDARRDRLAFVSDSPGLGSGARP